MNKETILDFSNKLYERMIKSSHNELSPYRAFTFSEEWSSVDKFYEWVLKTIPDDARWLDYSDCEGMNMFSPTGSKWVNESPSVRKIFYEECVYNARQFSLEFDIPYDLVNICSKYDIPANQIIQLKVSKIVKKRDDFVKCIDKKVCIKIEKAKFIEKSEWYLGDDKSWKSLFGRYKSFRRYMGRGEDVREWYSFESFAKWACDSGYPEGRFFRKIDKSGRFTPNNVKFYKDRK